jgi:hypothetical protein
MFVFPPLDGRRLYFYLWDDERAACSVQARTSGKREAGSAQA